MFSFEYNCQVQPNDVEMNNYKLLYIFFDIYFSTIYEFKKF